MILLTVIRYSKWSHGPTCRVEQVCDHMEEMRDFYAPFIEDEDETFDEYMTRMRLDCEWVSVVSGSPATAGIGTVAVAAAAVCLS